MVSYNRIMIPTFMDKAYPIYDDPLGEFEDGEGVRLYPASINSVTAIDFVKK